MMKIAPMTVMDMGRFIFLQIKVGTPDVQRPPPSQIPACGITAPGSSEDAQVEPAPVQSVGNRFPWQAGISRYQIYRMRTLSRVTGSPMVRCTRRAAGDDPQVPQADDKATPVEGHDRSGKRQE